MGNNLQAKSIFDESTFTPGIVGILEILDSKVDINSLEVDAVQEGSSF